MESMRDLFRFLTGRRALPQMLRVWLPALVLLLGATAVFLDLAGDVWLQEGFAWDQPLMLAVHSLSAPWLDWTMLAITQLGTYGVALALLGVSWWLWRQGDRWTIWALWFSLGGATVINTALKWLFARPRPAVFPPLSVETSYSFPSGHTIAAATFYGFLALYWWKNRRPLWGLLVGLIVPLVAFSRIYLGVHYPSDVLGALALGTIWLTVAWRLYRHFRPNVPIAESPGARPFQPSAPKNQETIHS